MAPAISTTGAKAGSSPTSSGIAATISASERIGCMASGLVLARPDLREDLPVLGAFEAEVAADVGVVGSQERVCGLFHADRGGRGEATRSPQRFDLARTSHQ